MVREVKLSSDLDRRFRPPARDSVLDDESPAREPRRPASRRRRADRQTVRSAAPTSSGSATERRHLAGADWLGDYGRRARP